MFDVCSNRAFAAGAAASMALCAPSPAVDVLPGPIPASVTRVIDGDTLEVRARIWVDQVVTIAVRLDGVDTPEIFRPRCAAERALGEAARDYVVALAPAEVTLWDVHHGKYAGRVVARVRLADGRDLAELLLAEELGDPEGGRDVWCGATG